MYHNSSNVASVGHNAQPDVDAVGLLAAGKVERHDFPRLLVGEADLSEAVEDVSLRLDGVEQGEDVDVVHVEVHSVDEQRRVSRLQEEDRNVRTQPLC